MALKSPADEIPYYALCYVRGNREPAQIITLNGATVSITPNLSSALRGLPHETDTLILWIDALCINQNDIQEKSSVARHTWRIYENAQSVLVWLGKEADDNDLAMEMIYLLNDTLSLDSSRGTIDFIWTTDLLHEERFKQHRSALEYLLARPYWSRAWIIQEVIAARSAALCCGSLKESMYPFLLIVEDKTGRIDLLLLQLGS